MTILTVGSSNPQFSFILSKNPATIQESKTPFKRQVRKGNIYGWFSKPDNSEFRILFKDSDLENSFSENGEFEYLDLTRYASPYSPIQIINEALRSAALGNELDIPIANSAYVEVVIQANPRIVNWLKIKGECQIEMTPLNKDVSNFIHKVKVTGPTVSAVLNTLQIICIIVTLSDESLYVPMNKEVVFKYLRSLNSADAPYALRHLFISRAITNRPLFEEARKLGILDTATMTFQMGNNQNQRLNAVRSILSTKGVSDCLLDIGCGELSHSLKLSPDYTQILAFEVDPEICEINSLRLKKRKIENIDVINQRFDMEFLSSNPSIAENNDVLLSEVLEHMDRKESIEILKAILNGGEGPTNVVVTMPNHAFNVNYGLEGQFRHDDHKWEPDLKDLSDFLSSIATPKHFDVEVSALGDVINSEPCSFMVHFKKVA